MNNTKPARQKKSSLLFALLAAFAVGLLLYLINFSNLKDYILASSYHPSPAAEAVEQKLQLTREGNLIFRASQPELHYADFSEYCATTDPDRAILGCYNNHRIHVYNIESEELAGIVESTSAHEFLHAVWERLPGKEKDTLLSSLNQIYAEHQKELDIISEYPTNSQATELYARVGTEIASLPEYLEAHYANYFAKRSEIVAFYEAYSGPFNQISATLDRTIAEIDRLGPVIEQQKADYEARSQTFTAAVNEFNACANKAGCFTASTFKARRNQLLNEEASVQQLYRNLSANISHYNELVETYNSNLLRERELVKIINPSFEGKEIND